MPLELLGSFHEIILVKFSVKDAWHIVTALHTLVPATVVLITCMAKTDRWYTVAMKGVTWAMAQGLVTS